MGVKPQSSRYKENLFLAYLPCPDLSKVKYQGRYSQLGKMHSGNRYAGSFFLLSSGIVPHFNNERSPAHQY